MRIRFLVSLILSTACSQTSALAGPEWLLVHQGLTSYAIDATDDWQPGVAKVCDPTNNCVFAKMWEEADIGYGLPSKQVAYFARTGTAIPSGLNGEVNRAEPLTVERLKKQWEGIQRTCQVVGTTGCGIASFLTPFVGAACGVAINGIVCTLEPEDLGIPTCDLFDPQPGSDVSYKLTPASKGAIATPECWQAAATTLSAEDLPTAKASCASAIVSGTDVCVAFMERCFYKTSVAHPAGTTVPQECRKVVAP